MPETADKLGVGVIGLGNSGWHYHAADSVANSEACRVTAVCARDPERAAAAGSTFGARAYTQWSQLLADPEVDIVVVALPHNLHLSATIEALDAGKQVIVEKPMAMTTGEADAMIVAAERAGRMLTVFQQRRWEADCSAIVDAIRSGVIGDVWRVEVCRSHRGKYAVAGADSPHTGDTALEWPQWRAYGGGVGLLIAPHLVDHVLTAVGLPVRTVSGRRHIHDGDEVEHYLQVDVEFDGGVQGRVEAFREFGSAPRWSVYGTAGTIVSRDGSEVVIRGRDAEPRTVGPLPPLRGCPEFYDAFAAAVRTGGPPPVTAAEGRAVVRVLELAATSAEQGGQPLRM